MNLIEAPDYWVARLLLQRGLGAVYLIAFVVTLNQFRPLLGEHGLVPVRQFLERSSWRRHPSLFHVRYSDRLLVAVSWTGIVLSTLIVAGVVERLALPAFLLVWLALWALYLSIANVGRIFYAFGWESLLLEAGLLAAFLGPRWCTPPALMLWLVRWLLFRVEFGAGLIKLRGDRCWRDLTCLAYHHETQPLPNRFSWRFHRLPGWLHRIEVLANHGAQLVAPFALFLPQPVAAVAAAVIIVTQLWLLASGNFSWLNVVTLLLGFAAITDAQLAWLPWAPAATEGMPGWYAAVTLAVFALVAVLSWWPVRNMVSRQQRMNATFNPLHFVNAYGAFGTITRQRHEIVLEGTDDRVITPMTRWLEYEFKAKPGDPRRRPPQVAPYHLRLDWLLWFAALGAPSRQPWMVTLVRRLLEGDAATLGLLRSNPFPTRPPRLVRARLYRYRFTTGPERRATGAWWQREHVDEYLPPLSLDAFNRETF
jgi:Lipase maturation factor